LKLDVPVGGAEIKVFGRLGTNKARVWLEPMPREISGRIRSRETATGDGAELAREGPELWRSESRIGDKLRAIADEASEKPVLTSSRIGELLSIKARAAALLGGGKS
jgi:hypothetical protein